MKTKIDLTPLLQLVENLYDFEEIHERLKKLHNQYTYMVMDLSQRNGNPVILDELESMDLINNLINTFKKMEIKE